MKAGQDCRCRQCHKRKQAEILEGNAGRYTDRLRRRTPGGGPGPPPWVDSRSAAPSSMPTFLRSAWIAPRRGESAGSLFTWGEVRARNRYETTPAGRIADAAEQVPDTSSVVPPAMLRFQLRQLLPDADLKALRLCKFAVDVPAADDGRVERPALPLQRRSVFGVLLPAPLALHLLRRLTGAAGDGIEQASDPPEAAAGAHSFQLSPDMLFWCVAWHFAISLMESGYVLPALRTRDATLRLDWRIWRGAPDLEADLQRLRVLMPAVNLAYEPNRAGQVERSRLLHDFLNAAVNGLMNRRMVDLAPATSHRNGVGHGPWSAAGNLWRRLLGGQSVDVSQVPPDLQQEFRRQWQGWISRAVYFDQTRAQVAFTLKAPSPDEADQDSALWTLELGVQQSDRDGGYLQAQAIWTEMAEPGLRKLGTETAASPALLLLVGLRVASRLWAPLRRIADTAQPTALPLTSAEAFEFLDSGAALLDAAGFRTVLPEWWNSQARSNVRLVMQLRDGEGRGIEPGAGRELDPTATDAFVVEWWLALEDATLAPSQIRNLAYAQSPLVYMNDRWLHFNQQQIEAARLSLAHETRDQQVNLFQALRLLQEHAQPHAPPHLGTWSDIAGKDHRALPALPVRMETPEGRLHGIWQNLQSVARDESLDEPPGFVGRLRPYQKRGLAWLWYLHEVGLGACLADDMGLGKTVQTIALFLAQEQARTTAGRLSRLLICPTSVLRNWQREIDRFAPQLRSRLHHGPHRVDARRFVADLERYDVILTSFGTARADQEILRSVSWHSLVVDEAQNIKNAATQQAQAIRSFTGRHKIALTGTPIENRLSELWSVLDFVNRGYLGSQAAFCRRYIRPIEGRDDARRREHLKTIVQPFVLRRLKSDPDVLSELPEKQEITITCDLTPEQTLLYAGAVSGARSGLDDLEGIRRRGAILALITRLRKITNHPALLQEPADDTALQRRSGKLDRLTEMLEEALDNRNKAIVFTTFVRMGELLQQNLQKKLNIRADFLHGGINLPCRQAMVDRFQNGAQAVPVLLLSLRTGGVGINLTAANQVYHYDRWWNPAVEQQATDRAHRIGQTRRVQVYKFMAAGTIEEHVDNLIRSKTRLAEEILGNGEAWLTELSNERLFELLSLP